RRRRRTPPPLPRPRGRVEPLAKQAVGWGQAPWRSWSVLCVPPSRPPPASGGGGGWGVACAPPPPAGEGGAAGDAGGGGGAGSLAKLVGAARAPPPGLPASGGRGGWRAVGAGPLRASGAVWGGVGKSRRICGRGCPVAPPPACGGRLGGGPANGRRPTIPR